VGLRIVLLTGGTSDALRKRYEYLGVEDIYMGAAVKVNVLRQIAEKYGYDMSEIIYMGDDVPDY
jgi:3-deoxy-D-manno-octulosonate 8-phosphate phosphatase (KDO 8-P phosphatase)